jgi:hypothetical protein
MPIITIEQLKIDAKSPLKCVIHGKVLKTVDLDTFVIGDGTGVIVLETSKHPKLSAEIGKLGFLKIFAPVYENGKLTSATFTAVAEARPIPIIEDPDLSLYVSKMEYTSVMQTRIMNTPDRVNMILKIISKTEPRQQKYSKAVFALALDKDGDEIDLTMYTNKWQEVGTGITYLCHNLQIDGYKSKGVNQLRTLAMTTFLPAPANLRITHTEDITKRIRGQLMSYNNIRFYRSCPHCHRSLSQMMNEECPHLGCSKAIPKGEEVNDFTLTFVFDDIVATAEFEHVQCYRRALGTYIADFTDETDLTPMLNALLDRSVHVKFAYNKNKDGQRVIDKIDFLP